MLSISHSRQIWKTAFLPVLDFLNLSLASGLAYLIRYRVFEESFEGIKQVYGVQYLFLTLLISLFVIGVYSFLGVYRILNKQNPTETFININIGVWFVLLGVITYLYFNEYVRLGFAEGGFSISRFILGTVGFFAVATVTFGRVLFWQLEQLLYKINLGKTEIVIVGKHNAVLVEELLKRRDIRKIHSFAELNIENFKIIRTLVESYKTSEIYLYSLKNDESESELAILAERYKVRFVFSPQGYGTLQAFRLRPIQIRGFYFFEMYYSALEGWQVVLKRILDIILSFGFIAFFSWLYLLIAVLIKLDSPGDIFYKSERIGPDGRVFKMLKFRRFRQEYCTSELDPKAKAALEFEQQLIKDQGESANRGALYKIKDDPRMTKMGRFLEKTSLDEIPQFFNVLRGNLSLVGPRAHQPREVKKYAKHQFKVLNIKPGITGYAQIKGRSDLSFDKEAEYDTWYVEHWNFWLDIWILIRTPFVILFKKHQS